MKRRLLMGGIAASTLAAPFIANAQAPLTLNGAVQFNDDHAFNKTLLKFEELVKKYYGKPIDFILHKQLLARASRSSISSTWRRARPSTTASSRPAHMSTFSKAAPFIDAPFLFRDLDALEQGAGCSTYWQPVADEVAKKADVMLIGYAGGGVRNIFINKPMRVAGRHQGAQGARAGRGNLVASTFAATGMSPTVIAYSEVYNAIQNNVISCRRERGRGR